MKKSLALGLIILLLFLQACGAKEAGPSEEAKTINLIMGHGAAEGSIGDLYCIKFKELVEEKSGGKITADVYSGSQLGTYGEMLQGLKTGDVSAMVFQPAPAVSFIPELAMLDLPYAFYGYTKEEIDYVLNESEFTKILDESFSKAGYKRMSFAQAATFRETTSNREIKKVADFAGLKLRVLENKYHLAFWKNVGANPTPLAFGELYLSLQQGLVDAQENPYDTAFAAKFNEVQKYLVNTHHIIYPNLFLVNKELYDGLSGDYKKWFDEAAEEAKLYAANLMAESKTKNLKGLTDGGMELIELSEDQIAELQSKASVVEDMLRTDLGDDVVDTFKKAFEEAGQ